MQLAQEGTQAALDLDTSQERMDPFRRQRDGVTVHPYTGRRAVPLHPDEAPAVLRDSPVRRARAHAPDHRDDQRPRQQENNSPCLQ